MIKNVKTLLRFNMQRMNQKELEMLYHILTKYESAKHKHPDLKTRHDGYAVILEELDETWDEIKRNAGEDTIRREIQSVGAMVLRFMVDLL